MLVARAAASHLERLAFFTASVNIDDLYRALNPPPAAEFAREFRVSVRFSFAGTVVEMGRDDAPSEKFFKHPQCRYGIAAAGKGAYDAFRAGPALTLRRCEEFFPRVNQRGLQALSVQTDTTVS